jgi:DNA-binding NtrC family response regulator
LNQLGGKKMVRTMMILVGDDRDQCEKLRSYGQGLGCSVEVYTPAEWQTKSSKGGEVPSLVIGAHPVHEGAKILQFPHPTANGGEGGKVRTINELESLAIENAIHEFGGNLTEAAKALGIGRATLYRKVKQYNIDPSLARRKRAA